MPQNITEIRTETIHYSINSLYDIEVMINV